MTRFLVWCRERPWTWAVVAGVACGAAGYGAGQLVAPTKVETKTETKWETKVEEKEVVREVKVEGPVHVVTRWRPAPETPPPPGCPECEPIIEIIEDRGPVTTTTDTGRETKVTDQGSQVAEKVVTRDAPRVALFATIGVPFSAGGVGAPQYGLAATARVLGPVSVIVAGSGGATGGQATAGVGLTF